MSSKTKINLCFSLVKMIKTVGFSEPPARTWLWSWAWVTIIFCTRSRSNEFQAFRQTSRALPTMAPSLAIFSQLCWTSLKLHPSCLLHCHVSYIATQIFLLTPPQPVPSNARAHGFLNVRWSANGSRDCDHCTHLCRGPQSWLVNVAHRPYAVLLGRGSRPFSLDLTVIRRGGSCPSAEPPPTRPHLVKAW